MENVVFVDTNVFLRFFVKDVEAQYEKARDLFEKADMGRLRLETNELVIAEIVWVLESFYGFNRKEISEILAILLSSRNLRIAGHARISEAIKLYSSGNMDFIDAFNIAHMKSRGQAKVATFDRKHYGRIEGVTCMW